MLGTEELGINYSWKFCFMGYGSTVAAEPGTIYIDLGNTLNYGIIDHHLKESKYNSSFTALVTNPQFFINHMLGLLNTTYYGGNELTNKNLKFAYTTHHEPDWDGVASFFACDYMLRKGVPLPEHISKALSEATDIIDQGYTKINGKVIRPFLIYIIGDQLKLSWEERLLKGKRLIEFIVNRDGNKLSKNSFLDEFAPPDGFKEEVNLLKKDYTNFIEDFKHTEEFKAYIPSVNDICDETKVLVFKEQPICNLHKFWAREESDASVLMIPFKNSENIINRVIISVRPEDKYTLPCLGYELEKAETAKRATINKERRGNPRFEKEYCNNADPWYDGRGHQYSIVDSPNEGTVLTYSEIIKVFKNLYNKPTKNDFKNHEIDAFISYRREGGSDTAWALKTILTEKGKNVFLDVTSLRLGKFDEQLLKYIQSTKYFLLVLSPGSLDRCIDSRDWVLREIQEALSHKKYIIPIVKPDFKEPSDLNLPAEITDILKYQAIKIDYEYFYAAVDKIIQFMNN